MALGRSHSLPLSSSKEGIEEGNEKGEDSTTHSGTDDGREGYHYRVGNGDLGKPGEGMAL